MAKKRVADIVAEFIAEQGIKDVFMISGGGNMHLVDAIGKNSKLKYICNHHEQASAIAAEGYARINKNLGVCVVTTGPGGTNTLTGLIGGWFDSIPILFISGQVNRDYMITGTKLRQLGIQENDIVSMVKSVTKYAITIRNPNNILYELEKAVFLAKKDRPGPVWIDIPSDIQGMLVDTKKLKKYIYKKIIKKPNSLHLQKIIEMINEAKRPIILAGHGIRISKAKKEFLQLVKKLDIPVLTSMSAPDLIPFENNLFIGRPGAFGDRAGNFAVANCDLLISMGSRMHLWTIGYRYKEFAQYAKKVMIDIDAEELKKKTFTPNLAIQADAKDFIKQMLIKIRTNGYAPRHHLWKKRCLDWKNKYPTVLSKYKNEKKFVNSYYFTEILSQKMSKNEVIFTGDGTAFTGTLQAIKIKKDQTFHCNVGCASMGWCLPAAIGGCIANNKKRTILITGDGSIMMNLQEIQTIINYKLPIKIFLLNNQGYLAIKITQTNYFQKKYIASDPKSGVSFPKFSKIADAFGLDYIQIRSNKDVARQVDKVLKHKGPVLCEIYMNPKQPLHPKAFAKINSDGTFENRPMQDMYPFISRKEYKKNMNN